MVGETSMANYSDYSKQLYRSIDPMKNKRSNSTGKPVKIHGLKYKFKIMDVDKYRDVTKYGFFDWPINYK